MTFRPEDTRFVLISATKIGKICLIILLRLCLMFILVESAVFCFVQNRIQGFHRKYEIKVKQIKLQGGYL